jgi:hypothetical protein
MRDLRKTLSDVKVVAAISGVLLSPLMAGNAMAAHCAASGGPCTVNLQCDDGSVCLCDESADCKILGDYICDPTDGICKDTIITCSGMENSICQLEDGNLNLSTDPTAIVR